MSIIIFLPPASINTLAISEMLLFSVNIVD